MNDYIAFSAYFGAALTLLVYVLANVIGRRLNHPLANPMLICLVLMIVLLLVLDIDYDAYNQSAPISHLPADPCHRLPGTAGCTGRSRSYGNIRWQSSPAL